MTGPAPKRTLRRRPRLAAELRQVADRAAELGGAELRAELRAAYSALPPAGRAGFRAMLAIVADVVADVGE